MADIRQLQILLTMKDKASAEIKKTGKSFQTFKKIAVASAAGAGVALAGFAVKSVQAAAKFETAISNINTLFDDTGESAAALGESIKDLSKKFPKDPNEIGAAAYNIVSAGISDTAQAADVLESSLKLAVGGLGTTEESVDLLTTALNAFGIEAEKSDEVADILFKTVKAGKTTVGQLSQAFGKMAGNASAAGIKIEDVQAATAALTSVTGKTSESQNALAQVFLELTQTGGKLDTQLREAGGSLDELNASISDEGLVQGMASLRDKLELTDAEFKNLFSSAEGGTAVFQLLTSANEANNAALEDMLGTTNALDAAVEKQNQTAENQFKILKNKLNVVMIDLGNKILPLTIDAMELLTAGVARASAWWDELTTALSKVFIAYDKIASAADRAFRAVKKAASFGLGGLESIGATVGGFITGRANGGIIRSGETTLVGEHGPELATFPGGTRITPNGGIGGGITINITGNTLLDEEAAEKISDKIMDELRLNTQLNF